MRKLLVVVAVLAAAGISAVPAGAAMLFQANLNGLQEVGPNNSPGTGYGTVLLNDAENLITVNENWSGLLAPATASHIHGPALPGVNAGVLFPLSGVPAATAGTIPEQSFAISAAQVVQLKGGLYYFNVHTSAYPGGEIRGQIVIPEPSAFVVVACGLASVAGFVRRKKKA